MLAKLILKSNLAYFFDSFREINIYYQKNRLKHYKLIKKKHGTWGM